MRFLLYPWAVVSGLLVLKSDDNTTSRISFGSGSDVNLFRSGPGHLRIDGKLSLGSIPDVESLLLQLMTPGIIEQFPAESCEHVLRKTPGASSGPYWVQFSSGKFAGSAQKVQCDMVNFTDDGFVYFSPIFF